MQSRLYLACIYWLSNISDLALWFGKRISQCLTDIFLFVEYEHIQFQGSFRKLACTYAKGSTQHIINKTEFVQRRSLPKAFWEEFGNSGRETEKIKRPSLYTLVPLESM